MCADVCVSVCGYMCDVCMCASVCACVNVGGVCVCTCVCVFILPELTFPSLQPISNPRCLGEGVGPGQVWVADWDETSVRQRSYTSAHLWPSASTCFFSPPLPQLWPLPTAAARHRGELGEGWCNSQLLEKGWVKNWGALGSTKEHENAPHHVQKMALRKAVCPPLLRSRAGTCPTPGRAA